MSQVNVSVRAVYSDCELLLYENVPTGAKVKLKMRSYKLHGIQGTVPQRSHGAISLELIDKINFCFFFFEHQVNGNKKLNHHNCLLKHLCAVQK